MHTYVHTCTQMYIHTYAHTYIHTYIHIYIRTYAHTYTHMYIHTYIHTYVCRRLSVNSVYTNIFNAYQNQLNSTGYLVILYSVLFAMIALVFGCSIFLRSYEYGIITIEEPLSTLVSLALYTSAYTMDICRVAFALLCVVRIYLIKRYISTSASASSASLPFASNTGQVYHARTYAALFFF